MHIHGLDHTVYGILLWQPQLTKIASVCCGDPGMGKGTITVCWKLAEAGLEGQGGEDWQKGRASGLQGLEEGVNV